MHHWRTTRLSPELVEFVYANKYQVSIPCTKYAPLCAQVRVTKTTQAKLKERDAFPNFTALIVRTAQALISESQTKLDLKQVRRPAAPYTARAPLTQSGRSSSG